MTKQSKTQSLTSQGASPWPAALLDETGKIVSVNSYWQNFAGDFLGKKCAPGTNYVEYCQASGSQRVVTSGAMAAALRAVLAKQRDQISLPYCHPEHQPDEWLHMHISRVEEGGRSGVIVQYAPFEKPSEELTSAAAPGEAPNQVDDLLRHTTELIRNASEALLTNVCNIANCLQEMREQRGASETERERLFDQALNRSQESLPIIRELFEAATALAHPTLLAAPPAPHILELIQTIARQSARYSRRAEKRYTVTLPVVAVPLDDAGQPAGEPFEAVTRDVSNRGIALIHTAPVQASYLGLDLMDHQGHKLNAILQVLRCRRVGAYYEIAGQFVAKITR